MLPESPKWLIEQKQYSDAETSLKTIAKWNGKTLKLDEGSMSKREPEPTIEVKPIMYWLGQRQILVNLTIMTLIWLATSFDYYLIQFLVASFKYAA